MSEWLALATVASALYLFECLVWIEASAIACFKIPLQRGWRCAAGASLPGNDRGGVTFVDPTTVRGSVVVCHRWPVSLSPAGVTNLAFDGACDGSSTDPTYIPFEEVKEVRVQLGDIHINDVRIARLSSPVLAIAIADHIRRIWQCPPSKRPQAITRAVAAALDHKAANAAWHAFQSRTTVLRMWCECVFSFTFIAAPLSLILIGPYPTWKYLLVTGLILTVGTAVTFFRSHKALFPQSGYDRWVNALAMVLLPVATIRCMDTLSRDALCGYGWAVVSPLLCTHEEATRASRLRLLDMRVWLDDVASRSNGRAADCARWFQHLLTTETQIALDRLGITALAPPVPEDETMVCFCPRCHAQFRMPRTECPTCVGVGVTPFVELPERSRSAYQSNG
jgi:hypothetical protein